MIRSVSVFMFAILFGATVSVLLGKDLSWDIANYHYYNPYHYLYQRELVDYWPTSYIHQFLNPAIDFLSYWLMSSFKPNTAELILGAMQGINLFLIYLLAEILIKNRWLAFGLATLGLCGPLTLYQLGSFQNDNLVNIFVLSALYLFLRKRSPPYLIGTGVIIGIAVGLKLTASIYFLGMLTALLFLPLRLREKTQLILMWGLAFGVGVFISSGFWMIKLWQAHHNPIFPFLNFIFHSPDFIAGNWRDTRFLPENLLQEIFFPFYFWNKQIGDIIYSDLRFAVLYVLFCALGLKACIKSKESHKLNLNEKLLFIFFISTYVAWQYFFSIARYFSALDMLAPTVIVLLLAVFIQDKFRLMAFATGLFVLLFGFTNYPDVVRAPWYGPDYFNLQVPSHISQHKSAVVLMPYPVFALTTNPRPETYLIPFFPKGWSFVGIPFMDGNYLFDLNTEKKLLAFLVKNKEEPVYLLTGHENIEELFRVARRFGFYSHGVCDVITSDRQKVSHQQVLLCSVILKRVANG